MNHGDLKRFIRIRAEQLGAPDPAPHVMTFWLNHWGQQFARDSEILRSTLSVDAVKDQETYSLDTALIRLVEARHNNLPLEATSQERLSLEYERWADQKGTPWAYFMADARLFRPWPTPDAALTAGFKLDVVIGWTASNDFVHGTDTTNPPFLDRYHVALAHAACNQLVPNDQDAAEYARLIGDARASAARRFSEGLLRVPYQAF